MDCLICNMPARPVAWENREDIPTCLNGHTLLAWMPTDIGKTGGGGSPRSQDETIKAAKRARGASIRDQMRAIPISAPDLGKIALVTESVVYAVTGGVGSEENFRLLEEALQKIPRDFVSWRAVISGKKKNLDLTQWIQAIFDLSGQKPGKVWSHARIFRVPVACEGELIQLLTVGQARGFCWGVQKFSNGKWCEMKGE